MKHNAPKKRYFIVCDTSRSDMNSTGYYDFNARIVTEKERAAKFEHLNEVLNFVQKYKIELGESRYIDLSV